MHLAFKSNILSLNALLYYKRNKNKEQQQKTYLYQYKTYVITSPLIKKRGILYLSVSYYGYTFLVTFTFFNSLTGI